MSVIVNDMRLPDCCAECELSESDDYGIYCNVLEVFMSFDDLPEGRRSDCPIFDENTETLQSIILNDRYGNVAEYAKVIRCKDCKSYRASNCWCTRIGMGIVYEETSFCCWAKPKEK